MIETATGILLSKEVEIRAVEKTPRLCIDSRFFSHARRVNSLVPQFPKLVTTETKSEQVDYLSATLNLPDFPPRVHLPRAVWVQSPEGYATSFGRMIFDAQWGWYFQPAMLHTGHPAVMDMQMAVAAGMLTEPLRPVLEQFHQSPRRAFMITIGREGPLIGQAVSQAVWQQEKLNSLHFTQANVSHGEADNEFERAALVYPINYEGLHPVDVHTLIISDNTASGMQHVAVIEAANEEIKSKGGKLKEVVAVSPVLTLYGASTIAYAAAERGIGVTFLACGQPLRCLPPLRYWSPPYLDEPAWFAHECLPSIYSLTLGDLADRLCVRGNWTGSFAAPSEAEAAIAKQLADMNISVDGTGLDSTLYRKRVLQADIPHAARMLLLPYSSLDKWPWQLSNLQQD